MKLLPLVVVLVAAGCAGTAEPVIDDGDAGVEHDGGPDGAVAEDAGVDGGHDAGSPVVDAGPVDAGPVDAGPPSARQVGRQLGTTDAGNGFYEYLPPAYGDGTPRPLLVFWHGIGEDGDGKGELPKVLVNGPPKLIAADAWSNDRPFVVLSPQHAGGGCPSGEEIHAFISWAASHYQVDAHRLYLTGLSCGAIGSWAYVGDHLDEQIAAAVLIAGDPGNPNAAGSVWAKNQCSLGRLPIWSFHGSLDGTVPIADDRDTMNLLLACPQPPRQDATFTEYPGVGHDSWTRTYDLSAGHDVYSWLLGHVKP